MVTTRPDYHDVADIGQLSGLAPLQPYPQLRSRASPKKP